MGYSMKWIKEKLGVTRDMIRYYEEKGLISDRSSRKSTNNYRDYSESDIHRIWGIKLLLGIGFTATEILTFIKDPYFDFQSALERKVAKLEQKHAEHLLCLEFAKTIKFTGRIPTVTEIGNMDFDSFLTYARENWNLYKDNKLATVMKIADKLISKDSHVLDGDEFEWIAALSKNIGAAALHGYYQVIANMCDLDHSSDVVQRVVHLIYEQLITIFADQIPIENITPLFIAKQIVPSFVAGDTSTIYQQNYGKDGCLFIAQALAYYVGYSLDTSTL